MDKQLMKGKRRTGRAPEGFERMKDLAERIGFSPSTIYAWIADEKMGFPAAVKLSRNVALFQTEMVNAWLAARVGAAPAREGA